MIGRRDYAILGISSGRLLVHPEHLRSLFLPRCPVAAIARIGLHEPLSAHERLLIVKLDSVVVAPLLRVMLLYAFLRPLSDHQLLLHLIYLPPVVLLDLGRALPLLLDDGSQPLCVRLQLPYLGLASLEEALHLDVGSFMLIQQGLQLIILTHDLGVRHLYRIEGALDSFVVPHHVIELVVSDPQYHLISQCPLPHLLDALLEANPGLCRSLHLE